MGTTTAHHFPVPIPVAEDRELWKPWTPKMK